MSRADLKVAIVGFGAVGARRAAVLPPGALVGVVDVDGAAAAAGVPWFADVGEMLERCLPDVVIVATPHHALADCAERALLAGAHVLVEKPGAVTAARLAELVTLAERVGRRLWVGYNHRYYPAIQDLLAELRRPGNARLMSVRAQYGHGGRPGYDREWRADHELAGGGELIDQGVHLLDLVHAVLGPVGLRSSLLRTAFWDMPVEDNAVLVLADGEPNGPWAVLQASCTQWRNEFVFDVYRSDARFTVTGLAGNYGPQRLVTYRRRLEGGAPQTTLVDYPAVGDTSWRAEWEAFVRVLDEPFTTCDCAAAQYALDVVASTYVTVEVS